MRIAFALICLILFPVYVYADNGGQRDDIKQELVINPYISFKVGYNDNSLAISDIKDFSNNTFSFNPAFGVRFEFDSIKYTTLRFETEYLHNTTGSNNYSSQRSWITGSHPYTISHYETRRDAIKANASGLFFNAYVDIELPMFIKPYITAGLGYGELTQENQWEIEVFNDSRVTGFDSTDYTENSEEHSVSNMFWQIGMGVSFEITKHVSLNAEYRRLDYGSINIYNSEYKHSANQFLMGAKYIY